MALLSLRNLSNLERVNFDISSSSNLLNLNNSDIVECAEQLLKIPSVILYFALLNFSHTLHTFFLICFLTSYSTI